jgi:hypothetical protein
MAGWPLLKPVRMSGSNLMQEFRRTVIVLQLWEIFFFVKIALMPWGFNRL